MPKFRKSVFQSFKFKLENAVITKIVIDQIVPSVLFLSDEVVIRNILIIITVMSLI